MERLFLSNLSDSQDKENISLSSCLEAQGLLGGVPEIYFYVWESTIYELE